MSNLMTVKINTEFAEEGKKEQFCKQKSYASGNRNRTCSFRFRQNYSAGNRSGSWRHLCCEIFWAIECRKSENFSSESALYPVGSLVIGMNIAQSMAGL